MRILVIRNKPPWPLHYGGRLHCYELCRRLAQAHELLLVAQRPGEAPEGGFDFECKVASDDRLLDDDVNPELEGYVPDRWEQFFGISMAFTRDVVAFTQRWKPDVVIGMNYQSLSALSRIGKVPTLCDLQDDEALNRFLELMHGKTGAKWQDLKATVAAMLYQKKHMRNVNAILLNSTRDERFCRWYSRHPWIETISHGVDCEYYSPRPVDVAPKNIVFWGSLSFRPNISALVHFAESVWPRLLKQKPELHWVIMGKGDSPKLTPLKSRPGIEWLGFVDDIRPHVAEAAVVVVPMVSGAGIKNKIMEAWAMAKPVVCTSQALGDLPGVQGENVFITDNPKLMTEAILKLIDSPKMRLQLGDAARQTAVEQCSWDRAAQQLEALCQALVRTKTTVRFYVDIPDPVDETPQHEAVHSQLD